MDNIPNPSTSTDNPFNPPIIPIVEPKSPSILLIVVLLIVFFPAAIYLLWKKDEWSVKNKLVATAVIVPTGLFVFLVLFGIASAALLPKTAIVTPQTLETPTVSPFPYSYTIINKVSKPGGLSMAGTPIEPLENFDILISASDINNAETIAKDVLNNRCTTKCNIGIWDDKKAWQIESNNELEIATSAWTNEQFEAWEKQNYVYIADHLIGWIEFESETYLSYPYKDLRYNQLKSLSP